MTVQNVMMDFEKGIQELESKIEGLRRLSIADDIGIVDELVHLESKLQKKIKSVYSKLTPSQQIMVARHPLRPHSLDYITALIEDFVPLAGDKLFAEDKAIVGGLGRFRGRSVVVIGQEKGSDIETRLKHNFGMSKPEGFRKVKRLFELADRFKLPVITLIDTAGAYPGIDAEERGQGIAIASCIETSLNLEVPIIATVIGEGGSGGAIALATANRILMLENSIYSVISPEGCASILWREREKVKSASEALKLTAKNLFEFGLIDEIIPEPLGGAHRHKEKTIQILGDAIDKNLKDLSSVSGARLKAVRRDKFIKMTR